jgi:O-methyltransferase involved in polyketide biosynthesis
LGVVEGVNMARIDSDSWDLASSVGATATMVAAHRAAATKTAEPTVVPVGQGNR